MSKLHVTYALVWFMHYIKESNVENINDHNQGRAWHKCIFFLVLYSRVVMETVKRAKLLVDSVYALSTVLAFWCLNEKQSRQDFIYPFSLNGDYFFTYSNVRNKGCFLFLNVFYDTFFSVTQVWFIIPQLLISESAKSTAFCLILTKLFQLPR